MSVIGTLILPIIILFILAVVLLTYLFGKKYTGPKSTKLLLGGYFTILVASVIVYYLLPDAKLVATSPEDNTTNASFEEIQNASMNGKIAEVEAIKEKKTWSLPYQGSELDVSFLQDPNGMHTVFERKESDDGTIGVIYYVANTAVKGIDFYDQVPSPDVSINGERLYVSNPYSQVKLSSFHNEFVISQFKGGGILQQFEDEFEDSIGPRNYQILYVKIPKNLELTGSEFIQFVGE